MLPGRVQVVVVQITKNILLRSPYWLSLPLSSWTWNFYEDGGDGVVGVLHLGLGQGSLADGAPIGGLQALIDEPLLGHGPEDLDLLGLKLRRQGDIGGDPSRR